MTHKPQKESDDEHLVELRDQAVDALQRFKKIAERLDFYKQYLVLSETYDVQMAGPFLVIKGGNPRLNRQGLKSNHQLYGRSSEEENSYCGR
jgi:hypothetical protein